MKYRGIKRAGRSGTAGNCLKARSVVVMTGHWRISWRTVAVNVITLTIEDGGAYGENLKTLFLQVLTTCHHFYRGS